MTISDCHTHLGRNNHIKASVKELIESMDEADIDKSLVFAGELNDCPNDWMLEQIAPYKDRLYGVGAYHPVPGSLVEEDPFTANAIGIQQVNYLVDLFIEGKIVAVKCYTGYDHYFPHEATYLLKKMNEVKCPVIFHSGDCLNSVKCAKLKYAHPLHIDEVAVDYPNINFIIAHVGNPWHRDTAEVVYKNSNVYTDISGFVYGSFTAESSKHFTKLISEFIEVAGGTDKLLFGSDWPISNQKSYVDTLHGLPLDNKNNIFSENARKVFNGL